MRRLGQGVVEHGAGQELAVVAVDGALPERLADALGDAAVELAVHDHRVDLVADIVDRDVPDELDDAGLLVDLDDRDVRAERPRAVRACRSRPSRRDTAPCPRAHRTRGRARRRSPGTSSCGPGSP